MAALRVHYLPDCEDNGPAGDTLAVTTPEAIERVNCPTCLPVMAEHGLFDKEPVHG